MTSPAPAAVAVQPPLPSVAPYAAPYAPQHAALSLLPRAFRAVRLSPRTVAMAAAGLGTSVCALAGLYPQFDDGMFRLLLAATTGPLAAFTMKKTLAAPNRASAILRALGLSAALGVANAVPEVVVLAWDQPSALPVALVFAFVFGIPTGFVYGVPLAVLSSLLHGRVTPEQETSREGADRIMRIGAAWSLVASVLAFGVVVGFDRYMHHRAAYGYFLPLVFSLLVFAISLVAFGVASVRIAARRRWLERVRRGLEPSFRVRVAEARDDLATLAHVAEGESVVEWLPDASEGGAYRANATGVAVARVGDV